MMTDTAVRAALREHWGLADAAVEPHHGGMNSATWFVARDGRRWVAKSVPAPVSPAPADNVKGLADAERHLT